MDDQKKRAYLQAMTAQLDEWEARLHLGKAKVARRIAGARLAAQDHVDDLREQRDGLRAKLDELKVAAEDRWEVVKDEVESRWAALRALVARRAPDGDRAAR
jgi:hypothetical protein